MKWGISRDMITAVSSSPENTYKNYVNLVIFSLTCKKTIALVLTSICISTAAKLAMLAHTQFLHFDILPKLGEDEVSWGSGVFCFAWCVNLWLWLAPKFQWKVLVFLCGVLRLWLLQRSAGAVGKMFGFCAPGGWQKGVVLPPVPQLLRSVPQAFIQDFQPYKY